MTVWRDFLPLISLQKDFSVDTYILQNIKWKDLEDIFVFPQTIFRRKKIFGEPLHKRDVVIFFFWLKKKKMLNDIKFLETRQPYGHQRWFLM